MRDDKNDIARQRLQAQLIVGSGMALFFSGTAFVIGMAFAPESLRSTVTGVAKSVTDALRGSADNIQR